MMKVKIVYMDAKELEVTIASKDSKKFFESIGNHQFYFDDRKGRGFWTDIDKVRHIVTEDLPDEPILTTPTDEEHHKPHEGNQGNREGDLHPEQKIGTQENES